jgi:DNA-binding NarL/FixJ family response regulator
MNAPGPEGPISEATSTRSLPRAAVVVDQVELFRLGVERVLEGLEVPIAGSFARAGDGLRITQTGVADLLIVGRHSDLKLQITLKAAKKAQPALKVMVLLHQSDLSGVARLLTRGADALLLRTAKADELRDAVTRVLEGERVVASALAVGTIGRVGPSVDITVEDAYERSGLSPKEFEVLGELASGSTYKEIAEALIVTQATVKTHLVHIYAKLGVKNRHEAVTRALALGLLA